MTRWIHYDHLVPSREIRDIADDQELVEVTGDDLVTLVRAKNVLHVYHDQDDDYIQNILDGVVSQVEKFLRQDAVKKTRRAYWKRNQANAMLPMGPHGNILSAVIKDSSGNEKVLVEGEDFHVVGLMWKHLTGINEIGQLTVTYESGYETPPAEITAAVFQELSLQYKNRKDPDTPAMVSYRNLSLEARHLLAPIMRLAI